MGEYAGYDFSTGAQTDTQDTTDPNALDYSAFDSGGSPDEGVYEDASAGALLPDEGTTVDFSTIGGLGTAGSVLANTLRIGPGGSILNYDSGSGAPGALVPSRSGVPMVQNAATQRIKAILLTAAAHIGRRVALNALVALVKRWGLPAAAQAFGLSADDLLFALAAKEMKGRGRGRRGPHLYTLVKRIKRGQRAQHTLTRWAHKAGVRQHHRAPARPRGRSRSRR
jgi:hypothetical protein